MNDMIRALNEVASSYPICGLTLNEFPHSTVLQIDIYVPRGIDRGVVVKEVAEALSGHLPIGQFPTFTVQETNEILDARGEPEHYAPMSMAFVLGRELTIVRKKHK